MVKTTLLLLFILFFTLNAKAQYPVKCMTPEIIRAWQGDAEAAERLMQQKLGTGPGDATASEYLSPSGNFRLVYDTDGFHAVPSDDANGNGIPDYIEKAAIFADSSWNYQVATLGFRNPVIPGSPYEIRFREINTYGRTFVSGGTTYIEVHRNFENFPPNDDPEGNALGALKVTIAHELKHAIQFVTNSWTGDSGTVPWLEMDATLMEDVVFPNVNDYFNYLDVCLVGPNCPIFIDPNSGTPKAYTHVTWMKYYLEQYSPVFWSEVWNRIGNDPSLQFVGAISQELAIQPERFVDSFLKNHLWHLLSGAYSRVDSGFADRFRYPTPQTELELFTLDTVSPVFSVNRLGARYIELTPAAGIPFDPTFLITMDRDSTAVAIAGLKTDGTAAIYTARNNGSGIAVIPTSLNWVNYERIFLVLANASYLSINQASPAVFTYKIEAKPLPQTPQLAQNFPNPFNPSTTIRFSTPEQGRVTLDVYDITGRHVAGVLNEVRDAGFGYATFDASELASGVYIYRMQSGLYTITRKMVLLK